MMPLTNINLALKLLNKFWTKEFICLTPINFITNFSGDIFLQFLFNSDLNLVDMVEPEAFLNDIYSMIKLVDPTEFNLSIMISDMDEIFFLPLI